MGFCDVCKSTTAVSDQCCLPHLCNASFPISLNQNVHASSSCFLFLSGFCRRKFWLAFLCSLHSLVPSDFYMKIHVKANIAAKLIKPLLIKAEAHNHNKKLTSDRQTRLVLFGEDSKPMSDNFAHQNLPREQRVQISQGYYCPHEIHQLAHNHAMRWWIIVCLLHHHRSENGSSAQVSLSTPCWCTCFNPSLCAVTAPNSWTKLTVFFFSIFP